MLFRPWNMFRTVTLTLPAVCVQCPLRLFICISSGSWFRASATTTMNKKPTRCTIVLKSLKRYCILIPLYMFRALLRP
jgi:hypothetical protein